MLNDTQILMKTNTKDMAKRIENFLKKLTIEELEEARNIASTLIQDYDDGYEYDCRVRSYGRNWTERYTNSTAVQDLCWEYNGDEGIVDVYTNNPSLQIQNYGNVYYFPTKEDAEKWRHYSYLKNHLPGWKKEWIDWENREGIPFNQRPHFAPYVSEEEITRYEAQVAAEETTIIMPVMLEYKYTEENEENI